MAERYARACLNPLPTVIRATMTQRICHVSRDARQLVTVGGGLGVKNADDPTQGWAEAT